MAVVVRWYQEEVEDNLHKSLFLAEEATAQRYFEIVTSEDDELDSKIDKRSPSRNESIKDLSDISEHTITIRVEVSGTNIRLDMLKWPRGIGINVNDRHNVYRGLRYEEFSRPVDQVLLAKEREQRIAARWREEALRREAVVWAQVKQRWAAQVREAYARQAAVYGDVYEKVEKRVRLIRERAALVRLLGESEVRARESMRRGWVRVEENLRLRRGAFSMYVPYFGGTYNLRLDELYRRADVRTPPGACAKCSKMNPAFGVFSQVDLRYEFVPLYLCNNCWRKFWFLADTSVRGGWGPKPVYVEQEWEQQAWDAVVRRVNVSMTIENRKWTFEEAIERIRERVAETDRQEFLKVQERLYDILESQKRVQESETYRHRYQMLRLQQRRIRVIQDIRYGDWFNDPEISGFIPEGHTRCTGCGIAVPPAPAAGHTGTEFCFDCQQIEQDKPFVPASPLRHPPGWFDPDAPIDPTGPRTPLPPFDYRDINERLGMLNVLKNNLDELKQVFIATLELSS